MSVLRITGQASLSSTVYSASSPAVGHCSHPCHTRGDPCHSQHCWLSQCCKITTAATASASSIWNKSAHGQGAQALHPEAYDLKSSTQPQRGCAHQKAFELTSYHLLYHIIGLNITLGTETQFNPLVGENRLSSGQLCLCGHWWI